MNYNDNILDNKVFNFFKQLMFNIALSVCIMLVGVLVLVYGFNFRLYEVLSWSQEPYFTKGDMVIVRPQNEYKVGDIIKFTENNELPTTHRLVGIYTDSNGKITHYICHGDNNQNADGSLNDRDWKDDAEFIQSLLDQNYTISQIDNIADHIQIPTPNQVEGKVLAHIDNYGTYIKFIKEHSLLFISILAGIWVFSNVIQNELDIRKSRRLM